MRTIPAFASIALVLLLAGCAGVQQAGPGNSSQGATVASANSTFILANCIAECDAWPETANWCKIGCQTKDAQYSKDVSKCDAIKSMPGTCEMFYATCLGAVAGELGSASPCERTSNSTGRDWCIVTSEKKIGNASLCVQVTDSALRAACLGAAKSAQ